MYLGTVHLSVIAKLFVNKSALNTDKLFKLQRRTIKPDNLGGGQYKKNLNKEMCYFKSRRISLYAQMPR